MFWWLHRICCPVIGRGPLTTGLHRIHFSKVTCGGGGVLGTAAGFGFYPAVTEMLWELRFGFESWNTSSIILRSILNLFLSLGLVQFDVQTG